MVHPYRRLADVVIASTLRDRYSGDIRNPKKHYVAAQETMLWFIPLLALPLVVAASVVSYMVASDNLSVGWTILAWVTVTAHLVAAVVGYGKQSRYIDSTSVHARIREGVDIARTLNKDSALDPTWRHRAGLIANSLSACEKRIAAFDSSPSVDPSRIESHVNRLHAAAVSMAHYQMLAGISEHAEVIARDIDDTLSAYGELTGALA